jgi:hypothetical protein
LTRSRVGEALFAAAAVATAVLAVVVVPRWTVGPTDSQRLTARLGPTRLLPPHYFGINYDYVNTAWRAARDPGRDEQLALLEPGTVRWPGGTEANFFDWRTGYPVAPPAVASCAPAGAHQIGKLSFTLTDLESVYDRTGAPPLFDLDLVTSDLGDQVAMLEDAKRDGIPIDYVELGNGLYNRNCYWVQRFPTATDYGKTVAKWVNALHRDFPRVLVTAEAALLARTTRARDWNAAMLKAARDAGYPPDAITLQDYPRYRDSLTADGLSTLFERAYASVRAVNDATGTLGEPLWIAEYNLLPKHSANADPPAQSTYAQGLFVAEMQLLAQQVRNAIHVDYWAAFGRGTSYAYANTGNGPELTPSGLALRWVGEAASCASRSAQITFSGGPTLGSSDDPALVGEAFSAGHTRREVLINLSGETATVASGAAIPAGIAYQQAGGDPLKPTLRASDLTMSAGTVGGAITLNRYSITLIGQACPVTPHPGTAGVVSSAGRRRSSAKSIWTPATRP